MAPVGVPFGSADDRGLHDASITVTLDTYGHLMPGSEAEAAGLVESYLDAQRERDEDAARAAGDVLTGAPTGARE